MLRYGAILSLVSIIFASLAIYVTKTIYPQNQSGEIVFANTYLNGTKISKITIKKAQTTIGLFLQDGFWRVQQADGYYANLAQINALLSDVNTSKYYRRQELSDLTVKAQNLDSQNGTLLSFYDNEDQLLDELIVGKKTPNLLYRYTLNPTSQQIWLVSGKLDTPVDVMSWVQQPLFNYNPDIFEDVEIIDDDKNQKISRLDFQKPFYNTRHQEVNLNVFLEPFSFMLCEDVVSASNFDINNYPLHRKIMLTGFDGLIVIFEMYSNQKDIFAKISFSTTPLPTAQVNAYIKDNRFLFDGWFFKLPQRQGQLLFNYEINE